MVFKTNLHCIFCVTFYNLDVYEKHKCGLRRSPLKTVGKYSNTYVIVYSKDNIWIGNYLYLYVYLFKTKQYSAIQKRE